MTLSSQKNGPVLRAASAANVKEEAIDDIFLEDPVRIFCERNMRATKPAGNCSGRTVQHPKESMGMPDPHPDKYRSDGVLNLKLVPD